MHFDDDAFISYAHLDNRELVEGRKGWVANLHRALEIRIGMFLGKEPHIWRDPKLTGNDVFAETLVERLKRAAVLIAVVTPRYVKSDWARKELSAFCRAAEEQGGLYVRQKSRIFKVLKTPVPFPAHPPELQPLLGFEFFTKDPETGRISALDEVFGESAQREFWMRLDDLAHAICALLEELDPVGDLPPVPSRQEAVFLAETTSDLREQRETIKRDLEAQGYTVLPAQPLPCVADEVRAAVHSDLATCHVSIHLFGGNYGVVPEGGDQSLLELQNELAIERARNGGFCRLLWIPCNVKVVDDRQEAVLEQLRNNPRLEREADLLVTFLEDFRTFLQTRLDAARTLAPVTPSASDATIPALPGTAADVQRVLPHLRQAGCGACRAVGRLSVRSEDRGASSALRRRRSGRSGRSRRQPTQLRRRPRVLRCRKCIVVATQAARVAEECRIRTREAGSDRGDLRVAAEHAGERPFSHARGDRDPSGGRRLSGSARAVPVPFAPSRGPQGLTTPDLRFNPFPGLRPFEADEDHLFFGREEEIDALLRRLRVTRFLSVVGTSGSGKSSLVRSGLIPALYSGSMVTAGTSWRVAVMRPGEDPIGNLSAALSVADILGTDPQLEGTADVLLQATLRRSTRGLVEAVRLARIPAHDNLLVVVDQFEELFRFRRNRRIDNSRDESIAFVKLLLEAAVQIQLPIYIILTMRSDFIGDCMDYPGLSEAVNSGQYLVPRMQRDALRLAITGPVAVGGGTITPRLVLRLLNDIGDDFDRLPGLQHALMRSWDHWVQGGNPDQPLDIPDYEAVGTLRRALSIHADETTDETYAQMGSERGKRITERLFKALTDTYSDPRGVRRPTAVSELAAVCEAGEAEVIEVVDIFRLPGRTFLMPPAAVPLKSSSIVDLSHESLMRCWGQLVTWAEEERTAARFYMRLSQAAAFHARDEGHLWIEPELDLALKWKKQNRPTEAWARRYNDAFAEAMAFLDRSARERDRLRAERERERKRTLRRARAAAAVFGGLFLIAGYSAYVAQREQRRAETNLRFASEAVEQTLSSAEVNPAQAGADAPEMVEFRGALLEKAKSFYAKFLEENPSTQALRAEMAFAHFRLGHISRMLEKPQEAEAEYQQAVEQFTALDREFPSLEYKRALGNAYNWLGETLRPSSDRVGAARTAYDRAFELQTALVASDAGRTAYREELARTQYNRGILLEATSKPGDPDHRVAEADFRAAINLLENDARASRHELARAYNNLANLIANDDAGLTDARLAEAGSFYDRAIEIDERLLAADPANRLYKFELAKLNNNAAELLRRQKRFDPALERSHEAVNLLEDLSRAAPSLTIELADAYQLRGFILESSSGDPAAAYTDALRRFQILERDPASVRMPSFHWRFNELLLSLAALTREAPETRPLLRQALSWYLSLADRSIAPGEQAGDDIILDNVGRLLPDLDEQDRRATLAAFPRLQKRLLTHK